MGAQLSSVTCEVQCLNVVAVVRQHHEIARPRRSVVYPALPHDAYRDVHASSARPFLAQPLQHNALIVLQWVCEEFVLADGVVA